jgi:hypothetical protein
MSKNESPAPAPEAREQMAQRLDNIADQCFAASIGTAQTTGNPQAVVARSLTRLEWEAMGETACEGAAALRQVAQPSAECEEKDLGAGLIGQIASPSEGTEAHPTEYVLPEGYWAYHELVIAEVRKQLLARGTPRTFKERDAIAMAVRFFDVECTYDEDFARGDNPADVAEANIEAADWELPMTPDLPLPPPPASAQKGEQ